MNARGAKSTLTEKITTALISLGTSAVVGCCALLFKTTASLSRIEQSLSDEIRLRNEQQATMNRIQLKLVDHEVAITRIETKQNIKPQ